MEWHWLLSGLLIEGATLEGLLPNEVGWKGQVHRRAQGQGTVLTS